MSQNNVSEEGHYLPARRFLDCSSTDYDMVKAAKAAEEGAANGDPDAQYLHALFMYNGAGGITEDRKTAEETFSLAMSGGSREATIVSMEFSRNEPEVMDKLLALRLRGEQKDTDASRKLFELYDNGKRCVKKDHAEAIRFYTACAECDDAVAQDTIGFMFLMGKGVRKDREKAVYWLKRAADNGSGSAMYHMGQMYDQGLCDTEPDLKNAVQWYRMGAEAGDMEAQFALGCIYSTPRIKYTNEREAAQMFLKAAEQGHAEAAYQIGMMSAYGQGVKRDPSVAVKWLERAAEGGFQQAMVDYANMSFEGQVIPKDLEKAAHWFTVAANRCNGYAQYALA